MRIDTRDVPIQSIRWRTFESCTQDALLDHARLRRRLRLWVNRAGTDLLGPNHADGAGWNGDHSISDSLHSDFAAWQAEFERAAFGHEGGDVALDWPRFHARGIGLAKRLKAELGDAARVFYVNPVEDRNYAEASWREVLTDGSLVACPRGRAFLWLPSRVISGGQTGVDRAGLDWARAHGIPHGGWCPKGRIAEDGPIAGHYNLRETESAGYRQRTMLNVQDSDATLILNIGELDGGTAQTAKFAVALKKPYLVCQLDAVELPVVAAQVVQWLNEGRFATLNVAGPREEKRPGVYAMVMALLDRCQALALAGRA